MLYYDQIFHVAFEAGITLPGGGTSQSVALADDAPAVPQIGGVRRVDNIEANSYGVKLTLGETRVLVPWPKVRQCAIRRVEQQLDEVSSDSPSMTAPQASAPVDVAYTPVEASSQARVLVVEAAPAKSMTTRLPYVRAKDR